MSEAFVSLVGVEAKIDRDETVLDLLEEQTNKSRLILADKALHERVKEHLKSHSAYHRRYAQWTRRFGPF